AEEQRARCALLGAIFDDGLGGREDVGFVERTVEARAAMAGRTESHLLRSILGIRLHGVVGGDKVCEIFEIRRGGRLSRSFVRHVLSSSKVVFSSCRRSAARAG